jgi:predicted DCC family thiol-disulfide oxidoreductase YuxK
MLSERASTPPDSTMLRQIHSPPPPPPRPSPDAGGPDAGGPVILYDGQCGLCSRSIQLVLDRDRPGVFRFAALDGAFAAGVFRRRGMGPSGGASAVPDAVALVEWPNTAREHVHFRTDAVLRILGRLPLPARLGAWVLRAIPRAIRDAAYDRVARLRHRIFGRVMACAIPSPEVRRRFLD